MCAPIFRIINCFFESLDSLAACLVLLLVLKHLEHPEVKQTREIFEFQEDRIRKSNFKNPTTLKWTIIPVVLKVLLNFLKTFPALLRHML